MNVALVGGTGFIGGYLVDALLAQGHTPRVLVRKGSETKLREARRCEVVQGDVSDKQALAQLLRDADAVIFNIGILREEPSRNITFEELQQKAAERVIRIAGELGVSRLLLMSANGVRADGTPYQRTKFAAEEAARASGLDVTIFRPSVVFGDPCGLMEIGTQLYRDIVRPPIPAPGFISGFSTSDSTVRMSPVHVADLAEAMVATLERPDSIGRTYIIGGPETLSWSEMIHRVAAAVGRSKWVLPVPVPLMRIPATLLDWIPAFPVTNDQLSMLAEGNEAAADDLRSLIGREPRAFSRDNLAYLSPGATANGKIKKQSETAA